MPMHFNLTDRGYRLGSTAFKNSSGKANIQPSLGTTDIATFPFNLHHHYPLLLPMTEATGNLPLTSTIHSQHLGHISPPCLRIPLLELPRSLIFLLFLHLFPHSTQTSWYSNCSCSLPTVDTTPPLLSMTMSVWKTLRTV